MLLSIASLVLLDSTCLQKVLCVVDLVLERILCGEMGAT